MCVVILNFVLFQDCAFWSFILCIWFVKVILENNFWNSCDHKPHMFSLQDTWIQILLCFTFANSKKEEEESSNEDSIT
jgi:hypothetical protein